MAEDKELRNRTGFLAGVLLRHQVEERREMKKAHKEGRPFTIEEKIEDLQKQIDEINRKLENKINN